MTLRNILTVGIILGFFGSSALACDDNVIIAKVNKLIADRKAFIVDGRLVLDAPSPPASPTIVDRPAVVAIGEPAPVVINTAPPGSTAVAVNTGSARTADIGELRNIMDEKDRITKLEIETQRLARDKFDRDKGEDLQKRVTSAEEAIKKHSKKLVKLRNQIVQSEQRLTQQQAENLRLTFSRMDSLALANNLNADKIAALENSFERVILLRAPVATYWTVAYQPVTGWTTMCHPYPY
ncbi:MAG: hypothetical protein JWM56_936 [Candidatus Peribacteria bacterium]|nr:hypothetical protein [Candidatus Peribacteria bacterium]